MNRLRPRSLHRIGLSLVLASALVVGPLVGTASATSQTMKRSLTNIAFAPVDLALSPVTSAVGVYQNIRDIDDSPGVRFAYPIPGYVFALGTNLGGSMLRLVTGLLQFVPAVPLMFSE